MPWAYLFPIFWHIFQILKTVELAEKDSCTKKHSCQMRKADQNKLELNHSLRCLRNFPALGVEGFGGPLEAYQSCLPKTVPEKYVWYLPKGIGDC